MLRDSGDVVRIADATRILGFTRTQAAKLLSRWAGQGWLRRVGHGERAGTKREWGKTRLTPHRPKPSLQYVIAEIDTDDGITGVGEACTDIGFFGEPVEEVQSAIDLEARSDLHRRQSVHLAPFAAGPPAGSPARGAPCGRSIHTARSGRRAVP